LSAVVSPWSERIGGLVILLLGLGIAGQSFSYPLGTINNMGAGFFPLVAGLTMALLGGLIFWKVPDAGQPVETTSLSLRPAFFVFGGILAWALLLRPAGLIAATVALSLLSAFAYPRPDFIRIAITVVVLPVLGWLLFIYGLGMPMRAFPW
jgi:Tripartite tricarboxylate transporter TctB family.